jgi:hypothetical protein
VAEFQPEPPRGGRRAVRRAWLPLVWLLGTSTAVLVGWSAVQAVVGQVVQEQPGPLSAQAVNGLGASPAASPTASPQHETPGPVAATPPPASPPASRTPAPGGNGGTTPPPASSNSSRTFTLQGGTVDVTCQNNQISLYWATPNAGFQVQIEWHDSNTVLEVRFTSSSHESRIETWCTAGQVQSTIEEQSS